MCWKVSVTVVVVTVSVVVVTVSVVVVRVVVVVLVLGGGGRRCYHSRWWVKGGCRRTWRMGVQRHWSNFYPDPTIAL